MCTLNIYFFCWQAVFLKKKMYYNMRRKTLRRKASAVVEQGRAKLAKAYSQASTKVREFVQQTRELEQYMAAQRSGMYHRDIHFEKLTTCVWANQSHRKKSMKLW